MVSVEEPGGSDVSGPGVKGFYEMAFKKESSHDNHVLALLVTGAPTEKYYAFESEKGMVSAALEELDVMFGDDGIASRTFTGEHRLEDWGRQAFTKGMWVEGFKITRSTRAELNAPLENKVNLFGTL